jgi:formate dehydrogenase alpha subunit
VPIQLDGLSVVAHAGDTILAAATRAGCGDRIPTLCHIEGLEPLAGCRLCVVAVAGEGRPVAACSTPVREGMVIATDNAELRLLRREVLELLMAAHPGAALDDPRGGRESKAFVGLIERFAATSPRKQSAVATRRHDEPYTHPYLRFAAERCITCRRCLQVCEDVQGEFVFAIGGRGGGVSLRFGTEQDFAASPCVSCGACVEVCPTGALFDRDRSGLMVGADLVATRSVCGYCGVGCNVEVVADGKGVVRVAGERESPVNAGHLCAKGRYAHGWASSTERLTQPLLREGERFLPVSWAEAMNWAARRLRELSATYGADSLGVLTSSRSTNEAAYLLQKIFRILIGTNNVDCCARVCHSSTALALSLATGTGAASASYADIEAARIIVIAGANPTEAHPVIGARLRQAARRGTRVVVIDPRAIELANYSTLHLQIEPGTNVALFNAMARVLLEEGLENHSYVAGRTENLDELRALCENVDIRDAAEICGVPSEQIREAARLIARHGPALFVTGLGLSELTQGTDSVLALINLALLTGSIGVPGAGMLPLRGQNNVQGNADMGSAPGLVTGYQPVADVSVREHLRACWGAAPPANPGLTIPEMLEGARAGRIRGLWIQGEDVAQSDPNETAVRAALGRLDLLVVQELFLSETARFAHLVLPAAGALEQDGTFTNGERRIQRVRRAVPAPGMARQDWQIAADLATALGATWRYETPADVMEEIACVAPALFGGVSYRRLEGAGLQWPCPTPEHGGTTMVHAEGFVRGRGRFFAVPYLATTERRCAEFPYILITGRILQHYNVGTMTRRTPNRELVGRDALVMHPADASACGLEDGDLAFVKSRYGASQAPVHLENGMRPGTVFLSFHFPETHANSLTSGLVDPRSRCPDYKVTAVSVSRFVPEHARDHERPEALAVAAVRS